MNIITFGEKMSNNNLCSYGCGCIGKYQKRGRDGIKWSCSDNIQHCPAYRERQSNKIKESRKMESIDKKIQRVELMKVSMNKINQKTGLTIRQENTIKMVKTRTNNDSFRSGAKKTANTKKNTIDPETGQTLEKLYAQKAQNTRSNTIDPETGLSIARLSVLKGIKKRHTVDETGLSPYDRGQLKSKMCKRYKDIDLFYGSSYEFKWLEYMESIWGIEWVKDNIKRGPLIRYNDPLEPNIIRYYPADFLIGNKLIEIKSSWIFAKTNYDKLKNISKLDKALQLGYDVRFVLNHNEYIWANSRDYIIKNF